MEIPRDISADSLAKSTDDPGSVPSVGFDSLRVCSAKFRDRTLDGEERGINDNFSRSASAREPCVHDVIDFLES